MPAKSGITTKRGKTIGFLVRKTLPNGTVRLAKSNRVKRGHGDMAIEEGMGTAAIAKARMRVFEQERMLRAVSGLLKGWKKGGNTEREMAIYFRGKIESNPEILPHLWSALKQNDIELARQIVNDAGKRSKR